MNSLITNGDHLESNLSHIAFLVSSVDKSAAFLNTLRIQTEAPKIFESEGTKEIYVGTYAKQSGLLLLLEAISEGPYHKAYAKRGPGLHHIAIDVLQIIEFVAHAEQLGWQVHPISAQTISNHQTAWLFKKGIPCLIEIHQTKSLTLKPMKVSNLMLPLRSEDLKLFEGIGLGKLVTPSSTQLGLTIDGSNLLFSQLK